MASWEGIFELFFGLIDILFERKRKKVNKKNIGNLKSLNKREYNITKILDLNLKMYIEPKKSIFYTNLKKDQNITIFGDKNIKGTKWYKIETENGEKGWCILSEY